MTHSIDVATKRFPVAVEVFVRFILRCCVRVSIAFMCLFALSAHAILEFGDYNGDGKDDLLFVRDQDYVCSLSEASGVSRQETVLSNLPDPADWHLATQGDFNGDGNTDLLFRHPDNRWEFVPMEGCAIIESARQMNVSIAEIDWRVVGISDLNGDDRDDLVLRDDAGSWAITLMDGADVSSTVNSPVGLPEDTKWYVIGMGDFNGDNSVDILLKHRDGDWHLATSANTSFTNFATESVPFEANPAWRDETTADFDGDRRAELLLRHADGSWKVQSITIDGETSAEVSERLLPNLPDDWDWRAVATGDIKGEGKDDLVLADGTNQFSAYTIDSDPDRDGYQTIEPPSGATLTPAPIYFPDLNFRRAIHNSLNTSLDSWIFPMQLKRLQSISTPLGYTIRESELVRDIRGLQFAENLLSFTAVNHRIEVLQPFIGLRQLTSLNLHGQRFEFDLSPIQGLTSLSDLNLGRNYIADGTPLQNLIALKSLNLLGNPLADLSFLSNLTALETLDLCCTGISDISALSSLVNLKSLYLLQNYIEDLSPISKLSNLQTLDLSSNRDHFQLKDITDLGQLRDLTFLNLEGNLIENLDPLTHLTKLQRLYLSNNRIHDLNAIERLINLRVLDLGNNDVVDISPLRGLVNLVFVSLEHNRIVDIETLLSLSNLNSVDLSGNPLSEESSSELIRRLTTNGVSVVYISSYTFRDSKGRSAVFSFDTNDVSNVSNGVLVYFHGNISVNSAESYVVDSHRRTKSLAAPNGLVAVVIASPHANTDRGEFWTPQMSGVGVRSWNYNEDLDLVHEMLQTGFGGRLQVDKSRVFMWGSSQGTCFLNQFVRRFGNHYGGGFYGECGCSEGFDPLWRNDDVPENKLRVLINAPTGDFLHTLSVQAYGYYKYVLDLEVIGDLSRSGHHCAATDISNSDAINWLATGEGLREYLRRDDDEAYFERVSLFDRVVGMAIDRDGALWVVQQERTGDIPIATLWRSVDEGQNYESINRINAAVYDLDSVDDALFVTTFEGNVLRSLDRGRSFSEIELDSTQSSVLIPNGVESPLGWHHVHHTPSLVSTQSGTLLAFLKATNEDEVDRILESGDLGNTWQERTVPTGQNGLLPDPVNLADDEWYLTLSRPVQWLAEDSNLNWRELNQPDQFSGNSRTYRLGSVAWDGRKLLGYETSPYGPIWSSDDNGFSWDDLSAPSMVSPSFGRYGPAELTALDHGDVLIIGGGRDGHIYNGHTNEWRHIHGGAAIGIQPLDGDRPTKVVVDPVRGDIYVSDGRGIFKIDSRFRLGFPEPSDISDQDADGIPDALDSFPMDEDEYLDTDGDGIGNVNDDDDDGDGRIDAEDAMPLDRFEFADLDGDGVGNVSDNDLDGDGEWNALDAFAWNVNEFQDIDGDGTGNWEDTDDDNDGTVDTADAFPLYAGETEDSDGDFIGDNIDPHPSDSTLISDEYLTRAVGRWSSWRARTLTFTTQPTSEVIYPERDGWSTLFASVRMGDTDDATTELVLMTNDGVSTQLLYIDRNGNGDVTDDGLEMRLENGFPIEQWYRNWVEVKYESGETLPYTFDVTVDTRYENGDEAVYLNVYQSGKVTFYSVTDDVEYVVAVIDADADGVFNGDKDYVCIDHDQDATFDGCERGSSSPERFTHGEHVAIGDHSYRIAVSASGYRITLEREAASNTIFARRIELQVRDMADEKERLDERAITSETFEEFPYDWRHERSALRD